MDVDGIRSEQTLLERFHVYMRLKDEARCIGWLLTRCGFKCRGRSHAPDLVKEPSNQHGLADYDVNAHCWLAAAL